MLVLEASPDTSALLPFIDDAVRGLGEGGMEARYILVGPVAYERLRHAVAQRYGRAAGHFEQVQFLPVVVDPFRADRVCVVPAPRDAAENVRAERLEP
ncbi:MAG: family 4C encapsulin nanocompartment shell protein [Rubricoccaceae bacterium]